MGTQDVRADLTPDQRSRFMRALLRDVQSLEHMLADGLLETGVRRIGAEQEMVLVDRDWQPAPIAMELLDATDDERITTEVARFNVEGNLTPLAFTGDCLARMHAEVEDVVESVRKVAHGLDAEVILTGILPTLAKRHLGRGSLSDRVRYYALDDALKSLRGGNYKLQIEGLDEVSIEHDSVVLEGLNTSFQLHYQIDPERFAAHYNVAQLMAGPLLAGAANSPSLFGKRLWRETRIAIFQQTVDTRLGSPDERDVLARVRFGERWVQHSPLEIFREDIAKFRVILGREIDEDPFEALAAGRAPQLQALQLHNSTVYRWNRACYGCSEGKPHLRIENRILPAGPTILDEIANAAMWFGLMRAGVEAYPDLPQRLDFDDARANFYAAARQGMHAEFTWLDGRYLSAQALLLDELVPLAREGLRQAGVDDADADRYLEVFRARVETRRTGAQWLLKSGAEMKALGTRAERLAALSAAIAHRQHPQPDGTPAEPVHRWTTARIEEGGGWTRNFQRVEQYMTREILTVHQDDTLDLVVTLMDWEHIRHIPVEDRDHRLVGIVGYRTLLSHLARNVVQRSSDDVYGLSVRSIMKTDPVSVSPETSTLEAIALMKEKGVSALPVTDAGGRLVGIVTEHDFMGIAGMLLEQTLRSPAASGDAPAPPTPHWPLPGSETGREAGDDAPERASRPAVPGAPAASLPPRSPRGT